MSPLVIRRIMKWFKIIPRLWSLALRCTSRMGWQWEEKRPERWKLRFILCNEGLLSSQWWYFSIVYSPHWWLCFCPTHHLFEIIYKALFHGVKLSLKIEFAINKKRFPERLDCWLWNQRIHSKDVALRLRELRMMKYCLCLPQTTFLWRVTSAELLWRCNIFQNMF